MKLYIVSFKMYHVTWEGRWVIHGWEGGGGKLRRGGMETQSGDQELSVISCSKYAVHRRIVWDTITEISDQLRGPLATLGGPQISTRGHWAFSENNEHHQNWALALLGLLRFLYWFYPGVSYSYGFFGLNKFNKLIYWLENDLGSENFEYRFISILE